LRATLESMPSSELLLVLIAKVHIPFKVQATVLLAQLVIIRTWKRPAAKSAKRERSVLAPQISVRYVNQARLRQLTSRAAKRAVPGDICQGRAAWLAKWESMPSSVQRRALTASVAMLRPGQATAPLAEPEQPEALTRRAVSFVAQVPIHLEARRRVKTVRLVRIVRLQHRVVSRVEEEVL
jgi:hypothetical protein